MSYDGKERRDEDRRMTRIEDNLEKISDNVNRITTENAVMGEHVNNLTDLMQGHVAHDQKEHDDLNIRVNEQDARTKANEERLNKIKWLWIGATTVLILIFTIVTKVQ